MKKLSLLILILFCLQFAHANKYYLFTNTIEKATDNRQITQDSVTWLFDTEKQTITLFTEREDVRLNYRKDSTIKESTFDKYIIDDNSSIIYVDKETLQIVYIIDKRQFIFKP